MKAIKQALLVLGVATLGASFPASADDKHHGKDEKKAGQHGHGAARAEPAGKAAP